MTALRPDDALLPGLKDEAPVLPLTLDHLSYTVSGQRLIDDVCLTLEAGPTTIVLGPNGAGKSLLMRLCHGLLKPSGGAVRWHNTVPSAQAMVFQRPVLLRRSARANIDYALKLAGMGKPERKARIEHVLVATGLSALADRPARVLSGGEQQRLALARAWALAPQVLFLDEPTANLDPAAVKAVEDIICTIKRAGTRIIMSTHDLGQAKRLADEVVFMHRGRIVEKTPAETFFMAPESDAASAFLKGELFL